MDFRKNRAKQRRTGNRFLVFCFSGYVVHNLIVFELRELSNFISVLPRSGTDEFSSMRIGAERKQKEFFANKKYFRLAAEIRKEVKR